MSTIPTDRKAVALLAFLMLVGAAVLVIPWFLTPPAFLDLALRDAAFGADLTRHQVTVTDEATGKSMTAPVIRSGNTFLARIGRINSGRNAYRAQIAGYKPATARIDAAALQNVRAPIDFQPAFGRLEITPVNATKRDEPVPATVKQGERAVASEPQKVFVLDLPPGKHRLTADAQGFCPADREYEVEAGKITKAVLPLSPDLKNDEIARFVLGWRNEPRDLDSHFLTGGLIPGAPLHLYYQRKRILSNGKVFATLDVDELYPGRYETVTVRADLAGDFRYLIHRYAGFGTIGDADAMVQVYTRGCRVQTFHPPDGCIQNVWNVAKLRNANGRAELTTVNNCEAVLERPANKSDA